MTHYRKMQAAVAAAALCAAILVSASGCTWRKVREKIVSAQRRAGTQFLPVGMRVDAVKG